MVYKLWASLFAGASATYTADYRIYCASSGVPKGTGSVLCDTVVNQANELFNGTLDGNFTLLIGHRDMGRVVEAKFGMEPTTVSVIASASKWLSAAAILRWLDTAQVSLSQPVHEYVPWWQPVPNGSDPRQLVTLKHVISQTDGFGETLGMNFTEDGPTIYAKDYANLEVPQKIFTAVPIENFTGNMTGFDKHPSPYIWGKTPMDKLPKPGEVFYYEETHWRLAEKIVQIADASGRGLDAITAEFAASFGMNNSKLENIPQLGGPEWLSTAADLEIFLKHVVNRDFLKVDTQKEFERAHTNQAHWFGFRQRSEWGYALGSWAHCPTGACSQFSSIGIFGTFPFVDYESGLYYALVRPAGMDKERGVFLDRSVAFWERTYPTIRDALKPLFAGHVVGTRSGTLLI